MPFRRLSILCSVLLAAALQPTSAEEVQGLALPVKQVSVSSPTFQEIITAVLVEEGDVVQEGQELLQLRSEKERLEVLRTQKLIELGEFKSKGADTLFREKMGSREKAMEEQAQLELARILHQQAEVALREKTLRSPLSGTVVKKYKEAGEAVERAEKLFDIVNIDQIYVQFYIDPKLIPVVRENQEIDLRFPVIGPDSFKGKIAFVDPRIDAGSGLFRIKVRLENPTHKIKPNMRCLADFSGLAQGGNRPPR
jgi:membrane fusion protein (multidrug efflux system)